MEITLWGTRGSIAAPGAETVVFGGNTTCVEVTLSSGRSVIIDAGTGIRRLGDALITRGDELDLVLLMTHIHWDHVLGIPFFGPIFRESTHMIVDGFTRGMQGLRRVFSERLVDGTWPVRFDDLLARIEPGHVLAKGPMELGGALIQAHRLQHPQGGVGFRFTENSTSFVFLTDNELRHDGWIGTRFEDFVSFCRDADLLIHDCQYLPEEMEIRRGWGHSDVESVAQLAVEAGVKSLILFHHDPWRTDEGVTKIVGRCQYLIDRAGILIPVDAAREDTKLRLPA
ncbi:MAG: MBL fold metallo-hydrolase [Desulfomonile sp.]|nr:MBL fold metallo-hydrolase [Desulfomonile sp.]